MKTLLSLIALFLAASTFAAAKTIVKGADHFELVYEMTLPKITAKGTLWIPLAGADDFPKNSKTRHHLARAVAQDARCLRRK